MGPEIAPQPTAATLFVCGAPESKLGSTGLLALSLSVDESSYLTHSWNFYKVVPLVKDLSYLALVDVELDGVFVDDGVKLVDEDVLEVDEHLVDLVELLPPPCHGVQARRVLGQVAQVLRMQDLFEDNGNITSITKFS